MSPRARLPRRVAAVPAHLTLPCVSAALLILGAALSPPATAATAAFGLVSDVCYPTTPVPAWYTWPQTANQWMGVAVGPHYPASYSTYLGIHSSEGGARLASSEIANQTNVLVRQYSGGGEMMWAQVYAGSPGAYNYSVVWDDGQGPLTLPAGFWKNYGGPVGECGLVRIWNLALTAGHSYAFRLSTTVAGDDLRMMLLLTGGQNGWLGRADSLLERPAGTDTTRAPYTYTPATTGTYAFVVFNNTLATTGGRYKVEVWDQGAAAKPNLVIDHIEPESAVAGTPVTATVYVRNTGAASAGPSDTRVSLDGTVKCALVATGAIPAGGVASITCALGPLGVGSRGVEACADADNEVDEGASGESDNCRTETIAVGAPDLVVTGLSPTWAPANQALTVTITVKNQGGAAAGASATRLKLDGVTKCAAVATPALAAGASTSVTCGVGTLAAGAHSLEAAADINGQVAESDEGNNTKTGSVVGFLPDLHVNGIMPDQEPAGTDVTVYVQVRNAGYVPAGASQTRVRLNGSTVCASLATGALDAGGSTIVACHLGVLPIGEPQVEACADVGGAVVEGDEGNNCVTETVTIVGPDLVVTAIDPRRGTAGEPLIVNITVRNQGAASAGASATRVRVEGVTRCNAVSTPAISAAGTAVVQCDLGSFAAGFYDVEVIADVNGQVAESNEANNTYLDDVKIVPDVTWTVNPEGTGDYPTIQAAINAATDGVVIGLTDGFFDGPGNVDLDYLGKRITILSMSGDRSACVIGVKANSSDRHRGFFFHYGEDSLSVLQGVTVDGGYMDKGGTVYCYASSPRFVNCVIAGGYATNAGGAIACEETASPILEDCLITDSDAAQSGGGLYCWYQCAPRLRGTTISLCTAGGRGGGAVFLDECAPILTDCVFASNHGGAGGAAMFKYSPATLASCRFLGNSAVRGGALALSSPVAYAITGCTFADNSATILGSDLYVEDAAVPSVQTSILAFGGGRPAVEREAGDYGSNATLSCCDLYGNPAGNWVGFIAGQLGIRDNFSADPGFCDRAHGSYLLGGDSPCAAANNPACGQLGDLPVGCRYVHIVRASGTGDYPTIQAAVDAVPAGDVVMLEDGTYLGAGNRDIDFGGKRVTVKSRSGVPEQCVLTVQGFEADPHRAFYFHSGEDSGAVVEGIKIVGGLTNVGGGIYCNNSSPRLRNLVFQSNVSPDDGGHMACVNHASPIVEGCLFKSGSANDQGGGLYCADWSSPRLTGCTFTQCASGYRGGGAVFSVNCFPTLTRCTFDRCSSTNGGGLCFVYAFGPVDSCVFNGNTAANGGGMQCYGNAQCTIRNCTFAGNSASSSGGGIDCRNNSSPSLVNTIIAGSTQGAAVARLEINCNPTLTCCDLWGNAGGDWTGYVADQYGVAGNVSVNPYFCDAAARNYYLESTSYCREGNNPCGGRIGALGSGCANTVEVPEAAPPAVSFLGPALPNPFTARTTVRFGLAQAAPVTLDIHDVAGRRVRSLAAGTPYPAGTHALEWDARDDDGRAVGAGVYFCRLRAGTYGAVRRMILLR
jgi:subtilase family serine protease